MMTSICPVQENIFSLSGSGLFIYRRLILFIKIMSKLTNLPILQTLLSRFDEYLLQCELTC